MMITAIETGELLELITPVLKNEHTALDKVDEHTDLRNFNLSSITALELIVSVEERYGILVSEDDLSIENVNTIHKLKQLILKYKAG